MVFIVIMVVAGALGGRWFVTEEALKEFFGETESGAS